MTTKNHMIQRLITLGMVVLCLGAFSGCSQIDVDTEEGLLTALEKREKLDKAIPKISGMVTKPESLKPYVSALKKLYQDGSSFDREVIQALAAAAGVEGVDVTDELNKAIDSKDYKQLMQAAYGVKANKNAQLLKKLLGKYDTQINPEVQRVILEAGTTIENSDIAAKAESILDGNLDETPFAILRTSCDVLAFQRDPKAVDTLIRVIFHQDGVGRTLSSNCTRALHALDKETVAPVLLTAFKLENKDLMDYVAAHPDTLTSESIRNNTANSLALYRYEAAIEPMIDYIANTRTIPVPGTLAIRPNTDPAWQMWASLVGVAVQSTLFAINDIGVRGNTRAKEVLMELFYWSDAFQNKFKNAIELTGTTNIEVSQRVNAFRVLRENDLLSNEDVADMIESLKGEEFNDEKKFRPFARASIGTDMVTYCAITSKAGDTNTIWQQFNTMAQPDGVFYNPPNEDPEAEKRQTNYNVSLRIEDVKPAFELADKCDTNSGCYADALKDEDMTNYARIKAIFELGLSGDHQYFQTIVEQYKNLDVFGQLYGTKALAQLGTRNDVETIEQLNKDLSKSMSQLQYQAAKPNLEGLVTTLANK